MLTPHRRRLYATAFAALVLAPESASPADSECGDPCAQADLSCRAAVSLCEIKIRAFELYMKQIDTGRPKYELAAVYRDVLRPHYPNADLAAVRFSFSDQQPPDNATTDCDQIYFNDAAYVEVLRDGRPNPKLVWLLHELAHPEQCAAAGGRTGYAKRWWAELEAAVRESGETIDLFQTTDQLVKQLGALWARMHDQMPMERAADAKAEAVLAELRRCCIAPDGTLTAPPAD
jgi:hypothetical protein